MIRRGNDLRPELEPVMQVDVSLTLLYNKILVKERLPPFDYKDLSSHCFLPFVWASYLRLILISAEGTTNCFCDGSL